LSEPASFLWNDTTPDLQKVLVSEPAHSDYNACIAWLPTEAESPVLKHWRGHEQPGWKKMYLLQNPLLKINPVTLAIELKEEDWGFSIHDFLTTHRVYTKRIEHSIRKNVEEDFMCVLYWAFKGLRVEEIMEKINMSESRMKEILQTAWDMDLAQAVPVDITGFRLQTLLGYQQYLPEKAKDQLASFWNEAVDLYGDQLWCKMSGDEELTYKQADELIHVAQKALLTQGLKQGDHIFLCGEMHYELLLTFWAAVGMGIVVIPLSSKLSSSRINEYVQLFKPGLVLIEPLLLVAFKDAGCKNIVMIDQQDAPDFKQNLSFLKWLEDAFESGLQPSYSPQADDIAVVLYTTGSTGNPKGIPITHSQLVRSGRIITELYHWKKSDKYYALGGLETMSGLRHATVSAAEAGACCIMPLKNANIYEHYETICKQKASILTANPSFYKQLLLVINEDKPKWEVRLALCAGNQLGRKLRFHWEQHTLVPLYNYYGLTETGGVCVAEKLESRPEEDNNIGMSVDCLIKIINEDGRRVSVNAQGELCIYGSGIFSGYYNNPSATANVLKDGWLHTGDQAVQHEDGSITLTGRLSDIIKLPSGERVELTAIEDVIENIHGLKDWAVCPLADMEKEGIAVFFVAGETEDTDELTTNIRQMVRERIGAYAIPVIIEPVTSIPRSSHNKVLRKELLDSWFRIVKQQ
ncbi:MAG: class I adenylate-forming enzyme family protein, partial [Ginsengibacter sp.]